jgi:hypothetical protein
LLAGGVDVLVATPGRLLGHFEKGSLTLSHTAALVLDEVDVLAGGVEGGTEVVRRVGAWWWWWGASCLQGSLSRCLDMKGRHGQ